MKETIWLLLPEMSTGALARWFLLRFAVMAMIVFVYMTVTTLNVSQHIPEMVALRLFTHLFIFVCSLGVMTLLLSALIPIGAFYNKTIYAGIGISVAAVGSIAVIAIPQLHDAIFGSSTSVGGRHLPEMKFTVENCWLGWQIGDICILQSIVYTFLATIVLIVVATIGRHVAGKRRGQRRRGRDR